MRYLVILLVLVLMFVMIMLLSPSAEPEKLRALGDVLAHASILRFGPSA